VNHHNPDITTELAARILRRVERIRRTLRRNPDLNDAGATALMYLDDIANLVHFNAPYGAEDGTMTKDTTRPPIVQPDPAPASPRPIVEDTP